MKSFLKLFIIFTLVLSQTDFFVQPLNALTTTSTNVYGGYHPLPPSATLTAGSSTTYITSLQSLLTIKGYYSGAIDGVYGQATTSAVASFQAANNLAVDGVAGPKTIASLTGVSQNSTLSSNNSATFATKTVTCPVTYKPVCGLSKSSVCNTSSIVVGSTSSCVQTETRKTYDNLCELENTNSLFLYNGKCDLTKPLLTAIDPSGNSLTSSENVCISGYEAACSQQIPVPCVKAPCGNDTISTVDADDCLVDQPVCAAPQNYQDVAGVIKINNYKNKCEMNNAGAKFLYNGSCDVTQPDKAISALKATKTDAKVNAELAGSYSVNVPTIQNTVVAQLQSIFKTLGYYTLPVDGVYGSATILAIEKYKASLGILNDAKKIEDSDTEIKTSTSSQVEVTTEP